jgi:hypothetical protein
LPLPHKHEYEPAVSFDGCALGVNIARPRLKKSGLHGPATFIHQGIA